MAVDGWIAVARGVISVCSVKQFLHWWLWCVVAVGLVISAPARAQSVPETAAEFAHHLDVIDGLGNLKLGPVTVHGNWAETTTTLHGQAITLVAFKPGGAAKPYIAVLPKAFKLASYLPIPTGTPIDGISFRDMAFVVVPAGATKNGVATATLPAPVRTALSHMGNTVDLKAGISIFGEADFQAAGAIKTLLTTVGHTNLALPLSGALPIGLFGVDMNTASGTIKDAILKSLDLKLPLPRLRIPGMPSIVSVTNARLAIVSQKKGGEYEVAAGVTGTLDLNFAGKEHDFGFNVMAIKGGHADKLKLQASTTDKISLNKLVHPLDLTALTLQAAHENGKWNITLSATTKFKNKTAAVTLTQTGKGEDIAVLDTSLKISDLIPGGASIPGLTDVTFTRVALFPDYFEVRGEVKGMDTVVVSFKHAGKRYIATNVVKGFDIGSFIPGVKGTPLDDATFENMVFIWAPKDGAVNGLAASALTPDIEKPVKAATQKVDLKPGINVIGEMVIARQSKVGELLSKVGAYKSSVPLIGNLSPKIFHPGSAASIKNEILDHLNLKIAIPKVTIPGAPNIMSIRSAQLAIRGKKTGDVRALDVGFTGEMDVHMGSTRVDFDFDIEIEKTSGTQAGITITGETTQDVKIGSFIQLDLKTMTLDATRSDGTWDVNVDATSTLKGKSVDVTAHLKTGHKPTATITTKMTLADMISTPGLPGLDDVEIDEILVREHNLEVKMKLKGHDATVTSFKRGPGNKTHIGVTFADLNIGSLIPGAGGSPLKDVEVDDTTLIWVPQGAAETGIASSGLPDDIATQLSHAGVTTLDLKSGLNLRAQMKLASGSSIGNLLGHVGIHQSQFPLGGALDPAVLRSGQATGAIKDAILDALDLKVPLPQLSLPGMSNVATVRKTLLTIKGVKKGNVREIDVDVAGELDVHVAGTQVAFDYDVDIEKPAGQPAEVHVSGKTVAGRKVTVNLIHPFILDRLTFSMNKGPAGWKWQVDAKTDFRSKPLDVSYIHDPAQKNSPDGPNHLAITTKMTLAEIVGQPSLPGLDDIQIGWVQVYDRFWRANLNAKGTNFYLNIFKPAGASQHLVGVTLGPQTISPTSFIPGTSNTPLKDVSLEGMSFVLAPAALAGRLHRNQMPRDLKYRLRSAWVPGNIMLKPGLNVFGKMKVHPTGEMAKLLKKVGVHDLSMPLNGGFSAKAFSHNLSGAAIKNEILDHLDVKVKLPTPHIAAVSKFVTFKNGHLTIKGKAPDGTRGIDVGVSGDVDVHVKSEKVGFFIDVEYEKAQGGGSDLHITGHTDAPWNHPMGIKFLDLESLKLNIKKKKKASGDKTFDIKMTAKSDIGSHSKLDIEVDVHEKNGHVTDAFFELDGPLKLSDIPGVKDIPNSSHFTLDTLKISEHGIEAKTSFGGKSDLDVYLFTGSGWNLIIRQDNFTMTELVPPLSHTPLKHIVLSEAAVVLSKDGLTGSLSDFSVIAQDALKDVYGANAANIDVESGLSLIAAFEHKKSKGGMSDAFSRLGLSEERVILMGDIGGIFGGPTKLDVEVDLSAHTGAKSQPKWMKKKPGATAKFSMIATETDGQFDVEFGIGVDINANVHGTELLFDAKVALEFEEEKIDVKIIADLKDKKGWHKPFGIPGFTLYEVGLDLGIDEDGAIHLGFDGNIKVDKDTFKVAADADLLPEALGAPQDIAFVGSADKVDMFFMEKLAIQMVGGNFKLDMPKGILPTFTKVKFAFVTPGAQDPDLHITGEGFALAGGMKWLDHEVGKMDVAVSPTGINASGKIDDIDLGPLHATNNHFAMNIGVKSVPAITMVSNVELLGIKENLNFVFNKHGLIFDADAKFGSLFNFDIAASAAIKGGVKHIQDADFKLDASLSSDPAKWMRNFGGAAVRKKFASFDGGVAKAQNELKTAQAKVNGLQQKIAAMRAKVKAEKKAAEGALKAQQTKVDHLQGLINGDNYWIGQYNKEKRSCNQEKNVCVWYSVHRGSCAHHIWGHCVWYHWSRSCSRRANVPNIPERIVCEARNVQLDVEIAAKEAERAGITVAKTAADTVLEGIEAGIEIVPTDLDPRVAALIIAKTVAETALTVAQDALKGVTAFANLLEKGARVFKDVPNFFALKQSSIRGDLQKSLHGTPVVLDMNVEIMGKALEQRLAFSLTDPKFDAEQFGFIALGIAMKTIIKGLEDIHIIPHYLVDKIDNFYAAEKAHINQIINKAVTANAITGKPGVHAGGSTAAVIAAMKARRAAQTATSEHAAEGRLKALEAAHKADYKKYCSVPAKGSPRRIRPVFDPCFYLNTYPDLAKAFGADFEKAAQHWVSTGIAEGRQGIANFSIFAYTMRYPAKQAAFVKNGKIDFNAALLDWFNTGRYDGNNTTPLVCGKTGPLPGLRNAVFDPCFYVNNYPDLKKAFGTDYFRAFKHWENTGIHEGRQSSADFAVADYIIRYPDLVAAFAGPGAPKPRYAAALTHWYVSGKKEGRNPKPFKACGTSGGVAELAGRVFDPCFYVNKYPDLKKQFGYNNGRAFSEWVGAGLKNGRQSSTSFDINAYVVRYPDLENVFISTTNGAVSYVAAMSHWNNNGKKEGRNPKPFAACGATGGIAELATNEFDPCYYLNRYPDLKKLFGGRPELATQQFFQKGRDEGLRGSQGFDISSYMLRYPDLTKAFIRQDAAYFGEAWTHWKEHGKKEGRNPAPLGACGTTGGIASRAKAEFDPCFYLNTYPDLKSAFGSNWGKAAHHWLYTGVNEGRQSSAGFALRSYVMRYDDLRLAFVNKKDASVGWGLVMGHWRDHGKKEGRTPVPLDCKATEGASGLEKNIFDPCFYLNAYTDLRKAFDGDWPKAAWHWENTGIHEVRQSSAGFSIRAYLTRYDDLRRAFVNPTNGTVDWETVLNHWKTNGKKEGRNPGTLNCGPTGGAPGLEKNVFDPCFYTNTHPDLRRFGVDYWIAAHHWTTTGVYAGLQSSVGFDIKSYLMRYDDLRRAFLNAGSRQVDFSNVLNHWWNNGKKEARNPAPFTCPANGPAPGLGSNVFDPCFYLSKYPDLRAAFKTDWVQAGGHWINQGVREGRQSSAGFSIKAYLNRYPDLQRAFGANNWFAALNHWYQHGKKEGRNPRP